MAVSLSVVQILNTEEELLSFPVEGSIRLSLTKRPDLTDSKDNIRIVRVDDVDDTRIPRMSDKHIRSIGDLRSDRFQSIEVDTKVEVDGDNFTLFIKPKETLIPNADYYVMISSDMTDSYYEITKPTNFGPSQITVSKNDDSVGAASTFLLEITSDSVLSAGSHLVGMSILKDGVQIISESSLSVIDSLVDIGSGMFITLDQNTPFLTGEQFQIVTQELQRLPETYIQKFTTMIVSDVIQPAPEVISKKLSQDQIISFYEDNAWGRRLDSGHPTQAVLAGAQASIGNELITSEFRYPDTITIDCKAPVDISTVTLTSLNIELSEAFGNYMLSDMGMYDPEAQYVINVKVVNTTKLRLKIRKEAFVPITDKIILELS